MLSAGRPGQPGADGGLRTGDDREPAGPEIAQQPRGQARFFVSREGVRRDGLEHRARVFRRDADAVDACVRELAFRPHGDGRVEGPRAFVEEVQRPDVERPPGQVDARRGGRADAHRRIIMSRLPCPPCPRCAARRPPAADVFAVAPFPWPPGGCRLRGEVDSGRAARAGPRGGAGRDHPVRPQRRSAGAGGRARVRCARPGAHGPAVGQRGPGGRARRPPDGAVHALAADARTGQQRRCQAGGAFRARAGPRAAGRGRDARLRAGARRGYQSRQSGDRRPRAVG